MQEVVKWMDIQESIYRQKARVDWVKLGDSNTKFFFNVMKQRQSRNRIDTICDAHHALLKTPAEVEQEFLSFYQQLLGSKASWLSGIDLSTVRRGKQLSNVAIYTLIAPVSQQEIDIALFGIDDSKAPGIDGLNSVFFKKAWPVIKQYIYEAVWYFFESGSMAKQWNCTTITLVPKISQPSYAKEYRPIACCTVLYKLISKILTCRLGKVIGEVVDDAQAGFIPGKHIGDNILLATELIRGYTQKSVTPRCMMKVDLKKAYDSLEWSFLDTMMMELGFPRVFIDWIMNFLCSVTYSLLINGVPSTPFSAKKGLRQGDPMSPFLFAIGMEYLSRCLHELKFVPDFNFHPKCEKMGLTHLMFADDLLMFSRADEQSMTLLFQAFTTKFSQASGTSLG